VRRIFRDFFIFLSFYLVVFLAASFSQETKVKIQCNLNIVNKTNSNIDSLDFEKVELFLKTFDSTCQNNTEFSEYSNEVLFKLLATRTILFVNVLSTSKNIDLPIIFSEIENPVTEYDLQPIYVKFKEITGSDSTINKLQKCIRFAASKSSQILNE